MVGFGLPETIRGTERLNAADLTPAEAVEALQARAVLETANVTELELFGRPAVRVDVHAPTDFTELFAGPEGAFQMSSAQDIRLAFVALDERLLIALVQAAGDELEAAWQEALPILVSADLEP
jgi:hypothetical protein